jgi:DNA-binding beta-propeller fold protein YncE
MRVIPWLVAATFVLSADPGFSQQPETAGPYKIISTVKVGGEGGFDYVYADADARKLYIPRSGASGRIMVFDLETLKSVGEIANTSAHGVAVDSKSKHGFGSSKPVAMWDSKSQASTKTIDVQGGPDGIMADPFNGRIYVLSHSQPNATVIDAKDGSIVGTLDLGGAPEQAVSDGKGHIYIDIEDKGNIAVVDAKTLQVTTHYDLGARVGHVQDWLSTSSTTSYLPPAVILRRWLFSMRPTERY